MARISSTREGRLAANQFTPVKGVVTEFTPTLFPTDAAIDADNCVFDVDGSVRRRPGLNFETQFLLNLINGSALSATEKDDLAVSNHLWKSVSNSGTLNIIVVQIGLILQFYAQIGSISANLMGEVDISSYALDAGVAKGETVQIASGIGNLYVVGKNLRPLQISLVDGVTFEITALTFEIRDFEGIDDDLEIDERPSFLKIKHYYNLRNQGWTAVNLGKFGNRAPSGVDTESEEEMHNFFCSNLTSGSFGLNSGNSRELWPSNADIQFSGFTTDSSGNPDFDEDIIFENQQFGNTPAPKGHFVLDPFAPDRNTALDCTDLPSVNIPARPATVAFHNGKLFMTSPVLANAPSGIYFSRTLTQEELVTQLRPEADPTAQEINDLVDTDGGFIPTPGIGEIYKLAEMGNGVLVGASNGIWYLSGADLDSGFTATSQRLFKISDSGLLSPDSYVDAENSAYYFSAEGIMAVGITETGVPEVSNLSERTIQTKYVNISAESRRKAKGAFIAEQRKVYWGYSDASATEIADREVFDTIIIFDLNIGGFSFYSLGVDEANTFPEVRGFSFVAPLADSIGVETVTTTTGEVVTEDDGTTLVQTETLERTAQITQLKLLSFVNSTTQGGWVVTFGEFNDRTFHDWRFFDPAGIGLNYSSFVEFGYNTFGTQYTRGQPTYVHSFFSTTSKNLDPGGYYELPPSFTITEGLNISQSVLEVLQTGDAELAVSQAVLEVLLNADPALRVSQSVVEVLNGV